MGIIKMSDMNDKSEQLSDKSEHPYAYREDPDTFYSNPVADGTPQLIVLGVILLGVIIAILIKGLS